MLSDKMKMSKKSIFIWGVILFLNLTSFCFAELKTKRDLKDVLPAADMFARKTEPFGHYLGYAADGGYFVGVVFLTTEVVPEKTWGYRGQIETLVGVDVKGKITGVKVINESENPLSTKGTLRDGSWFLSQFEQKDAGDNFIIGEDIDAITGATITSSTVISSIKAGLQLITEKVLSVQVDKDDPVKHLFFQQLALQIDFMLLWFIVGLSFLAFFKKNEYLRYFIMGMCIVYLGIFMGGGFSINDCFRLLSLHTPEFLNNLYWYSLVVIVIGLTVVAGRFYCGWICPFGAVIEIMYCLVPIQWKISEKTDMYLRLVKYVNLVILLLIAFLLSNKTFVYYLAGIIEPFSTFFNLQGDLFAWLVLILILVFSCAISRFYCKYLCPLGALFALVSALSSFLKLRRLSANLPQDNCKGCRLAQKNCQMDAITYDEIYKKPDIDNIECIMCNKCASSCRVDSKML